MIKLHLIHFLVRTLFLVCCHLTVLTCPFLIHGQREKEREREGEGKGKRERDRERDEEGEGVGGRRREMRERIFSDVSSYKGTNSMDQGPTLMTSFNLSYFLRGPISKYSYTGVRASNYGFWQGHIHSVHNTSKHTIPNWKLWYMPRKKKIEALFRAVFR